MSKVPAGLHSPRRQRPPLPAESNFAAHKAQNRRKTACEQLLRFMYVRDEITTHQASAKTRGNN
eukprot:6184114-Pleurochrysis_carterae.AAC.1